MSTVFAELFQMKFLEGDATMNILERIQELCKEQGTNPSKLEVELGFGKGTLYKWDKSSPNTDKLSKVADYFKVSLDYLLGRGDIYDIGWVIKEERELQGLSAKELAETIGVSEFEISQYENDEMPLTEELAKKISREFGMSYPALLNKYSLYDEYILPQFDGDTDAYEAFKKAVDRDAQNEGAPYSQLPTSEIEALLETLHKRPEMRTLFSVTKNATKEDIEKAVKIIEALKND